MQASINIYQSVAIGGFTAAGKVVNLMTAGMPSIGQTTAAYVGQNYGYGDLDRVHQGTKDAMKISVVYSIITGILSIVLMPPIVSMFFDKGVDISQYLPYSRIYITEAALFYITLAMIFIYRNAMQGCGFGKTALMLGVMELISRLATAFISMKLHSYAIAVAGDALSWFTTGIFSYILYRVVMKKLRERYNKHH